MLALSIRPGEAIRIGANVYLVVPQRLSKMRVAIEAAPWMSIERTTEAEARAFRENVCKDRKHRRPNSEQETSE